MKFRRIAIWAAAIAAALLLAACGGDTATSEIDPPQSPVTVTVEQFQFGPEEVTISIGQSVEWVNNDRILHTVTAGTPESPRTTFDGLLEDAGSTFSFTFDTPGTYEYFCARHPHMRGVITVTA